MTINQLEHIERFIELIEVQLEKEHFKRADPLLTLIFCTTYDIDWYPVLARRIGNW